MQKCTFQYFDEKSSLFKLWKKVFDSIIKFEKFGAFLKKIHADIICLGGASLSPSFTKNLHRYAKICKFSLSPTKNSTGFGKIELENLGKVSLTLKNRSVWWSETVFSDTGIDTTGIDTDFGFYGIDTSGIDTDRYRYQLVSIPVGIDTS